MMIRMGTAMDLFEKKINRIAFFTLVPIIALILILLGRGDFFYGLKEKQDINNISVADVESGVSAGGQVINCVGRFYGANGRMYYAVFGGYFTENQFIYILETDSKTMMMRLDMLASNLSESTIVVSANGTYKKSPLPVMMEYYSYLRSFPAFESMSDAELEAYAVPLMLESYEYKGRSILFIFGSLLMLFAVAAYIKYRKDGFAYSYNDDVFTEKAADADINSGMPIGEKSMASFMALQETVKKLSERKASDDTAVDAADVDNAVNAVADNNAVREDTKEEKASEEEIIPAEKILAVKEYITKASEAEKAQADSEKVYRDLQDTLNRLKKDNPDISLPVIEKTDKGITRDLRLTPFSKVKDPRDGKSYADLQDTLLRIRRENPNIGFLDPPDYFYEGKSGIKKAADIKPLKRPEVNPTDYMPQPKSFEEIVGIEPMGKKNKESEK